MLVVLHGCAAQKAFREGQDRMKTQDYDQGVLYYSKALALDPGNARYSVALVRAKVASSSMHFQLGKRFLASEQLELAIAEFQQVLLLNPGHQYALNELNRAARALRERDSLPSEIEQLKERARRKAGLGPPRLDPQANIPILLEFQMVKIGKIFEAIGKAAGINFIFDDKTDLDKELTIDIGNVTLEQALDILMLQTKNFYKPIDEYTLLIAPDTRQKRQEYQDQVIKTFYLSNADTKQVTTLLRSLLQARQIAENPDLNSITIKDSPDKVAIAERIIRANDKSKGEVLIDVELLEINRALARNMGIDLSSKTLSLSFRDGLSAVPLNDLQSLQQRGNWTIGVIPTVILDFLRTDGDTRVIAKPQLRVTEGEQAEILIGDRVPIPTTSFNTSQTIGGNIVPLTSFTYQNVGITVQIEARVHHNKEVTLKVQVEISQLGTPIETSGGQSQPTIGTRQIQTVIRLRDGETNILAGLIASEDVNSRSGVVGLSDIPGFKHIFGKSSQSHRETDIIMTLTPRIIRVPDITEEDLETLWVGTEENMRLRGSARSALNQGPFGLSDDALQAAPALPDPTRPLKRTRGVLGRISPSAEVEREREADARAAADAQSGTAPTQGVGAGPPPGSATPPPSTQPVDDGPGPAPASGGGPASVQLVPSKTTYSVGEAVVVSLNIVNGQEVGSVPFHLHYNTSTLQFIQHSKGPFLGSDGANTVMFANDTGGGGEIVVGLSRLGGGAGASGNGVLATFEFQAVAVGHAGFAFSGASVRNGQADLVPASFTAVPVQVAP
jgi:type II secretory pathway component GspD/PulD (secretin)